MKLNPRRRFVQVAIFSLMALGAGSALAQAERAAPGLPSSTSQAGIIVSPAQFKDVLQARERQLTSIEQLFTRIEVSRLPAEKEKHADELDNILAAYAKGMIEDFDTAMKQAELAAKSQGKQGSIGLVKPFEDQAVKHEQSMKNLDARAQKLGRDIEKGETKKSSSIAEPTEAAKVARGWPMLEKISNFLISPAHAAIAIPVVAACSKTNIQLSNTPPTPAQYAACDQASQIASSLRVQAQTAFNTCWNKHEGTRPKLWRSTLRTGCVTALVAKLA